MRRLTVVVLALIGSLLFAASASAGGRDANRDRIPDRWEKKHGLSLKVKQTHRDQDKDGFHNRAEWRAQTDPLDPDSDDDGVADDEENAGSVTAFANGELTIKLFDGDTLTAKVTEDTKIECGTDDASVASHDDEGDDGGPRGGDDDEEGDDGSRGDDDEGDDHGDDHGDDDAGEDDGHHGGCDDDGEDCGPEALTVNAAVEQAELKISSDGKVWTEIELR